jgi:hypothetical protein
MLLGYLAKIFEVTYKTFHDMEIFMMNDSSKMC